MTCRWRFKIELDGKDHEFFTFTDDEAVKKDLALPESSSLLRMAADATLRPDQSIETLAGREPQRVQRLLAASAIQYHISRAHKVSAPCAPELIPCFDTDGCSDNAIGGDGKSFLLRVWEKVAS